MDKFEEIIEQFAEKVLDRDGQIVYIPKEKYKRKSITLEKAIEMQQPQLEIKQKVVVGPDGQRYDSVADAARAENVPLPTMHYRVKNNTKGWGYEGDRDMKTLEDYKDKLLYRRGPCRNGHMLPDGTNPRSEVNYRYCVACRCRLPPGVYEFNFNNLQDPPLHKTKKYFTEEERIKARSAASARWNKKNKDKTDEYRKKYAETGRPLLLRKMRNDNMSPEKKEELLIKQRKRNAERYARIKADPEAYQAHLKAEREKQKARYDRLKAEKETK